MNDHKMLILLQLQLLNLIQQLQPVAGSAGAAVAYVRRSQACDAEMHGQKMLQLRNELFSGHRAERLTNAAKGAAHINQGYFFHHKKSSQG